MRLGLLTRVKKLDGEFWPGDNGKIFFLIEQLDGTTTLNGVTHPTAADALATLPPGKPEDLLIHLTVEDMSRKSPSDEK